MLPDKFRTTVSRCRNRSPVVFALEQTPFANL